MVSTWLIDTNQTRIWIGLAHKFNDSFLSNFLFLTWNVKWRTKIIIGDATSFDRVLLLSLLLHTGTTVALYCASSITNLNRLSSQFCCCFRNVSITETHFNFSVDIQPLNSWKSSGRVEKLEEFKIPVKSGKAKRKTRNQGTLQWFTLFETVWNVLSDHHSHCWISTEWSGVLEREHHDFLWIVFGDLLSNQTL